MISKRRAERAPPLIADVRRPGVEERQLLPRECKMPDLSTLPHLMPSAIAHAMAGDPSAHVSEAQLRRNLARLTDLAISNYQAARSSIIDQIQDLENPPPGGPRLFMLAFANRLEICIYATNRALQLFQRLKSHPISSRVPRLSRRALEAHCPSIEEMRDVIEHFDEAIRKGEISGDMPIMAALAEPHDRVQIGPYVVTFNDLARSLRELHGICDSLLNGQAA